MVAPDQLELVFGERPLAELPTHRQAPVVRGSRGDDPRSRLYGADGATEVPLTELVAVDRLPDGVKIVPREGSTRLFVTGDPQAGIVLQRLLNDDTHPHLTADAVVAAAEAHLRRGKITPG